MPFIRSALALEADALGIPVRLDDRSLERIPHEVPVHAAINHQLSPLMVSFADALRLDPRSAEQLQAEATSDALAALTLALETAHAWTALRDAGIPALAYKGVALSLVSTGSAVSRGSGDIDLLVDASDVLAACRILGELGYTPESFTPDFIATHWAQMRWSTREITLDGPRTSIDLHWRISPEERLLGSTRAFINRGCPIELSGTSIMTLAADDTLLIACYSLQHDSFRSLRQAVDLIRLLRMRTAPVAFQGRALAMAREAASFAHWLLGGLPAGRLAALGLASPDIARARALWDRNKHDPRTREPQPSLVGQVLRARGTYGHAFLPVELSRLAVLRVLTRRGERELRTQAG